jgi:hypothetical protein
VSEASREREREERPRVHPGDLRRRRWLLGLHLLLQLLCVAGAFGPWWQPLAAGEPFGSAYHGRDPATGVFDPWATAAILSCAVAFFFASYDLVSDADLQLPIFLASLVALGAAGAVFWRAYADPSTLEQVVDEVLRAGQASAVTAPVDSGGVASAQPAPGAAAAAAPRKDPLSLLAPGIRYLWGLALLVSAAPLLVVVSAVLTFALPRSPETPP